MFGGSARAATISQKIIRPRSRIFALLYWVMGRFKTRFPRYIRRDALSIHEPKIDPSDVAAAIEYSDCYLHDNDARFVFNFIRAAIDHGAVLVNACGPELDAFNAASDITTNHHHVFSKGVHLIVDRITTERRILAFFASDGRLLVVIPMGPKTGIGTAHTRVEVTDVNVTSHDRDFILSIANEMSSNCSL